MILIELLLRHVVFIVNKSQNKIWEVDCPNLIIFNCLYCGLDYINVIVL